MIELTTYHLIEAIGWAASLLTVAAYAVNTMLPLRILAIASSVFFLVYGILTATWPLVLMEVLLLPINTFRFWQVLTLRNALTKVTEDEEPDFSVVKSYGKKRTIDAGSIVFEKGDAVDSLYFLAEGRVAIEGVGVELHEGEIFGEMAFFTDSATRTATVRCVENALVYELDKTRFMRLQFEDPSFGMAIMRTITRRMQANMVQPQPA
ncbi:MAG: cyclic nucleotide-binding domain-containing protein [Pseudomonadota bacterium]